MKRCTVEDLNFTR